MPDVTLPHNLIDGTVADADQVMANFEALKAAVNALDGDNLNPAAVLAVASLALSAGLTLEGDIALDSDAGKVLFGEAGDVNLYRSAADTLKTDDFFSAANDVTARTGNAGQATIGAVVGSGGTYAGIALGAAADVNLYRAAADTLRTDDYFVAANDVTARRDSAARVDMGSAGPGGEAGIKLGAALDVNLYRAAANSLKTDASFQAAVDITARVGAATQAWIGDAGGGVAGLVLGAAGDTNLYRESASVLRTDDSFRAINGWMLAHVAQNRAVVSGRVSQAGAVLSGTGFTAVRNSTGVYTVTFSTAFSSTPAVVVTPGLDSTPWQPIVIAAPAAGSVTIRVVAYDGTPINQDISFVAIGPA